MKRLNLLLALTLVFSVSFGQKKSKIHLELFALFQDVPQSMSNADLLKNVNDGVNIPAKYFDALDEASARKIVTIGKVASGKYIILLYMKVDADGVIDLHSASIEKKSGEVYMSNHYLAQSGKNSRYTYDGSFQRSGDDLILFYTKTTEGTTVEEEETQYKFDKSLVFDKKL